MDKIPNMKLAERALDVPVVQDAVRGLAREDALLHVAMCYSTVGRMIMHFEREEKDPNYEFAASPIEACVAAVMMVHEGKFELVYEGTEVIAVSRDFSTN